MNENILAVDLGGTRYRAARASTNNPVEIEPLGEWSSPTTRKIFLELVISQMAEIGAKRLGVGIPGLTAGTTCHWVPNLPYLDGLDLATALPGVEIGLGNDAQLALLAEVSAGSAKGLSDAMLLAIGTGIGSAVISGGHIVAGASGGACSFGWAAADLVDPGDDRSGWLERQASGRALDAVARSIGLTNGIDLVDAARRGDPAALDSLTAPMQALGTALAGAVALLDPQAIILAGGVASSFDVLEPIILQALRRHLPPHLRAIRLRPGEFGARAGLVGASFAGALGPAWRNHRG